MALDHIEVFKNSHPTPNGDKFRQVKRWNEDHTGLEVVEEVDIQKEINGCSRGMSIPEQILRLQKGDVSVLSGSGQYGLDVSGVDPTFQGKMAKAVAANSYIEQAALSQGKTVEELKADLAAKQEELIKANQEKEKAAAEVAAIQNQIKESENA